MPHSKRVFLTAVWRDLVMLNYEVDPSLLSRYIPRGTSLDSFQGKTYLSLVGFQFRNTKMFGRLPVPFYSDFDEVNLRFYVRRMVGEEVRRGVVFIAEIVPKRLIAAVARLAYGENYAYAPMKHLVQNLGSQNEDSQNKNSRNKDSKSTVEYSFQIGNRWCRILSETTALAKLPESGSLEQFITEHYWGYSAQGSGCLEYHVSHEPWRVSTAQACFEGDASALYGSEFGSTLRRTPECTFVADGSPVTVSGKRNRMNSVDENSNASPREGWILYDGGCGFCSRWVQLWKNLVAARGFAIKDLQSAAAEGLLQLPQEHLLDDIRVLTRSGQLESGANAYLYVARRIWWAWPFYFVFRLPGFNWVLWTGYRWFNRNRYRVSRHCSLPQASERRSSLHL